MKTDPQLRLCWKNLYRSGKIPLGLYREGLRLIWPVSWNFLLSKGLLILGCLLLGAGVLFFFAYNWESLPRMAKLALAQAPLFMALILAWLRGLRFFSAKILLVLGAFFVGAFLAVFGQVYQTGADSYELFRGWALLILPLCILGNFLPLWGLNWVLVQFSLILFFVQIIGTHSSFEFPILYLLIAGFNALCLSVLQALNKNAWPWIHQTWYQPVLIFVILSSLLVPSTDLILRLSPLRHLTSTWVGMILLPVACVVLGRMALKTRDLISLSSVGLALAILTEMLLFRLLDSFSGPRWFDQLSLSFSALVLFSLLGWVLMEMQTRFRRERDES